MSWRRDREQTEKTNVLKKNPNTLFHSLKQFMSLCIYFRKKLKRGRHPVFVVLPAGEKDHNYVTKKRNFLSSLLKVSGSCS